MRFDEVLNELNTVRERGLGDLRWMKLPTLHSACVAAGTVEGEEQIPAAIENLLRASAEKIAGSSQTAVEYSLGLIPGTKLWSAADRRRKAAEVAGVSTETFRKGRERKLLEQVAEQVLAIVYDSTVERSSDKVSHSVGTAIGRLPSRPMHNLPGAAPLVGRESDLKEILDLIWSGDRVLLLKGPAGLGKSSLAFGAGHRSMATSTDDRKFDVVFQISAKAATVDYGTLADSLGRFLGNPGISAHSDLEAKRQSLERELLDRRVLLIVDNAESISPNTISAISAMPTNVVVLYTSRRFLPTDAEARLFEVAPLNEVFARELFDIQLDRLRLGKLDDYSDATVSRLLELTGGSPMAIRWVAGRLALGLSPSSVVNRLVNADGDLFESTFSDNWTVLDETSRNALMVASALGTSVDARVMVRSVSALEVVAEDAISELVDISLLEPLRDPGSVRVRYGLHPLARAYAQRRLHEQEDRRLAIESRMDAALLRYCTERNLMQQGRLGYQEIEDELESILIRLDALRSEAAASPSNSTSSMERYLSMASAISVLLWGRGDWGERIKVSETAAEFASELGDRLQACRHASTVGIVKFWQGRTQEAKQWANRAATELGESAKNLQAALPKRLLALSTHREGDHSKAIASMIEVLDEIREADYSIPDNRSTARLFADWICPGPEGYLAGKVAVTQEIGIMYTDILDSDSAIYWLDMSFDLATQIGDVEGASIALSHKGRALAPNDADEAETVFTRSLEMAREVDRRSTEGRSLLGLAEIALKMGRVEDGSRYLSDAIRTFEQLGMENELNHCLDIKSSL